MVAASCVGHNGGMADCGGWADASKQRSNQGALARASRTATKRRALAWRELTLYPTAAFIMDDSWLLYRTRSPTLAAAGRVHGHWAVCRKID